MDTKFVLIITADNSSRTAEFSLCDDAGVQLAYKRTDFNDVPVGQQRALFDLRNHLRLYVDAGQEQMAMADVGVCIAQTVLGQDIFTRLWTPQTQRTLRIQLPAAAAMENHLAAALARVPWEIARPKADAQTLSERNLVVRVIHDMRATASQPIELSADEPLRVLFVFAEARGSRPLGARQERRALLRLFERDIYPQRRVVAHLLTHGVTRERLRGQIQEQGGYHVVHWSGHGHTNRIELCKPGGEQDHISGTELLELFTQAGGFLPRLYFLSACHSGDFLRVNDWKDFFAVAQGQELGNKDGDTRDLDLSEEPGYTGTAHALLQGGVPSVVAMRYAVGDDYARELAGEFYRALLGHAQPKSVAAALTLARQAMLDAKKHDSACFAACDHATPVLYGQEQPGLTPAPGRSPALQSRNPRLHAIAELTTVEHEHFVGRTWELVSLGSDFVGSHSGVEVKPVAVITGLGGMGKTALTAEALALWEQRFAWVLLYQAKPNRLEFEATLRDMHMRLMGELQRYHKYVRDNPADAIYRDADQATGFTGAARLERLTRNLVRALRDEPILLVLDNFETNLKDPDPVTQLSACQDPAWDDCLARLASELVGSSSRVLITCRRPLTALAHGGAQHVVLGPLPSTEAALYLKEQPALGRMVFDQNPSERTLAMRLLNASRFHPLLMDRLAKLATHDNLRPQLLAALDALESAKAFAQLPALFATAPGDTRELAYLDDALAASLDQLIRHMSPDARRLLWIIATANQPEALGLVRGVWSGESHEQHRLRQIQQMLDRLPELPAEMQEKLKAMPPELRALLDALPPEEPARPDLAPLLAQLVSAGLATEERDAPDDDNPNLGCHELVRERIRAWMAQHAQDRAGLTENVIRLAYAERLEATFDALQHKDMSVALGAGSRALVYCVQAEAWDRLGGFASGLVTSADDPRLLEALVPHLHAAAESAPEGHPRWSCLCYLADALNKGGRPDASLTIYERAAAQARSAAEAGGKASQQAWSDLAWISRNWANALRDVSKFKAARERLTEAIAASKNADRPAVYVVGGELEALRIDIIQGQSEAALPEVVARLAQVEAWWQQHRAGLPVPEAPDAETTARVFMSALDVANDVHRANEDWALALGCTNAILEVKQALNRAAEDIASTRMNRAVELAQLRRYSEAKAELEACLDLFQNNPVARAKVLSSLADLFGNQGDHVQAVTQERRALALREQLPHPADRAISHNNLANYLKHSGSCASLVESRYHQLAALVYCLVAGLGRQLQTTLHNYAIDFRRAHADGTQLAVPRVAELLADPAFAPLEDWLRQCGMNTAELQIAVCHSLDQAHQAATTP